MFNEKTMSIENISKEQSVKSETKKESKINKVDSKICNSCHSTLPKILDRNICPHCKRRN